MLSVCISAHRLGESGGSNSNGNILISPARTLKSTAIWVMTYINDSFALHTYIYADPSQDLMLELFPLSHRIATGDSTNFTCRVPSPASFTWTFEDGPVPSNAVLDMTTTESILTITSAVDGNTGEYTCKVNNTAIGVVNEDTAYLDVTRKCSVN